MFKKQVITLVAALVAALLLGPSQPSAAAQASSEPTTWTVLVGGEGQIEQTEMGMSGVITVLDPSAPTTLPVTGDIGIVGWIFLGLAIAGLLLVAVVVARRILTPRAR